MVIDAVSRRPQKLGISMDVLPDKDLASVVGENAGKILLTFLTSNLHISTEIPGH